MRIFSDRTSADYLELEYTRDPLTFGWILKPLKPTNYMDKEGSELGESCWQARH